MSNCIAAHTNPGSQYPGYINFTREDDGAVTVILRSEPNKWQASYICGYASDKDKPGRCTPGDERCNNYCNLAPQKGQMPGAPMPCEQVREGGIARLVLSAADFEKLISGTVIDEAARDASVERFKQRLTKMMTDAADRINAAR